MAKQATTHGSPWAIANAPQHRALYIDDAHTQRFFENKCRAENTTPLTTAYRVIVQEENQAMPLQFQPLVCPHCKTAPCAAVHATQPNVVTNTKTVIDFNPLSQAACA
jgi:Fe-S-cluster-containing dehydrogenase component